ncbi:MAG: ribbon-helix-helix domain-containing protein [Candidatus Woesearchaeota archaeon]|nr:ribbon-helix-helix domain-containing protein [Candidatus Woesearchaeota archaeon]
MVMETLQVRMTKQQVKQIDRMIENGVYSSRSEAIRDFARNRLFWENQVGSIPNDGKNSVEEIRKIREILSKEPIDLDEINGLLDLQDEEQDSIDSQK